MKFPTMFSPVRIGTVTVPNRFVVPPMGNNFANTDGTLSDRSLAYYQARAKGGFGLITIESTVVYQEAKGGPRKPCLFSDDTVESFRRVADACHAYGAKVSIQLQHAGPEGNSALTGYPLKDLVKTTSWNQARALGLERVGRIEPGYLADLTILSGDFEVERVFVNGEERYSAEE